MADMAGGVTHVCYHYPCPDGIGACLATAMGLTLSSSDGLTIAEAAVKERVRFVPLAIFRPQSERVDYAKANFKPEDTVFIVDFSGGCDFIQMCCQYAKRVVILDHHKTAVEDLGTLSPSPPNLESVFDMSRSGVGIARDYFNIGEPLFAERHGAARMTRVLKTFAYLQDNDLWQHALPGSKEFAAGLASYGWEYDVNKNPGIFEALCDLDFDSVLNDGRRVFEEEGRIIAVELASSVVSHIPYPGTGGESKVLKCLALISEHPDLRSRMGNDLARKSLECGLEAAGAIAYVEAGMADALTSYKVSLRSIGEVDTTPLTKHYGGGGHKNASSCIVPREVFMGWLQASTPAVEAGLVVPPVDE